MNPYKAPKTTSSSSGNFHGKSLRIINSVYLLLISILVLIILIYTPNVRTDLLTMAGTVIGSALSFCLFGMPFYFGYLAAKSPSAKNLVRSVKSNAVMLVVIIALFLYQLNSSSFNLGSLLSCSLAALPLLLNITLVFKGRQSLESESPSNNSFKADA